MTDRQRGEGPPEAPEIESRLRFGRLQLTGLILLALFPVVALAGVFGESRAVAEGRTTDLDIRMRYTDRYRYKQINAFEIFIANRSDAIIDTVTVSFDTAYVSRFSNPTFVPSATDAFTIPLTAVRPGETRLVTAQLQAERYWMHEGDVRITSGGADTAAIRVRTLVFP